MSATPIHVDVFSDNPRGYDGFQTYFLEQNPPVRGLYQTLFDTLEMKPGDRVLEVGVGTGLNFQFYPPGVTLHGIDRSDEMLELARERARQNRWHATLEVGDAYALAYPDNHFDATACIFVACTLETPALALAELARVTRPGGRIALFDYHASRKPQVQYDQHFMNETMRRGIVFGGQAVICCDTRYDLDAAIAGLGLTFAFDHHVDESLAVAFRASVLQK